MLKTCVRVTGIVCLGMLAALPAGAQAGDSTGKLIVTVVDQTGGVLPTATVAIAGQEEATPTAMATAVASDTGEATFDVLRPGRYTIHVEFPGFEPVTVRDVRVAAGETRELITLQVAKLDEEISVARDVQSESLDPMGATFSTVLTREMIDALPDDPDEMEAVLLAMAPPGATIFVDGFSGGAMPPKYLIKSIRVPRMDNMAAQNHGTTEFLRINIQTQPGIGPLRGRVNMTFHDDVLSARNPFTPEKGSEQTRQGGMSLAGTLVPGKVSFSLNAGGMSRFTSPNLLAVLADGTTVAKSLRRPTDRSNFGVRVDFAFTADHSLRISFDRNTTETRNQGIGGFNLEDRAFRTTSNANVLRFAESGPVGQRMFSESRLQLAWSSSRGEADREAPTTRVIAAFTSGGAQVTGGQNSFDLDWSTDLDYVRGAHAWRFGGQVQGGRYRSDDTTNYLGTYTFSSVRDFNLGLPSTYTRRIGDPNITYSRWQTGVYLQDDWRAGRSVLISAGVRAGFQTLAGDQSNVSPRLTVGWAPFGDGGLTLRGSYGYLYSWITGGLYKQAQLLDGFRLRELNISRPSYPEVPSDGMTSVTNQYLWSDDVTLPTTHRLVFGVEKKLAENSKVNGSYTYGWGLGRLRGLNLNAPANGVRRDTGFANIISMVSDAESKSHSMNFGWSLTKVEWRRAFISVNYTWTRSDTNTTGAFSLPANGNNLDTEWGPSMPRHRGNVSLNIRLLELGNGSGMGLNLNAQAGSGSPYNITTGQDNNLDGLFNDRPDGISRNSAHTAGVFSLNGALNYSWRFGSPRELPDGRIRTIPRYLFNWSLNFRNLTNRENFVGYSGVMTSPFFGQPTNVANPRRLQMSLRFDF